jgi:hypothetical protein
MIHARKDYDRIQDPAGLIPEDEPVFLIRGKDKVAAMTVEKWADFAECEGASAQIVATARKHANAIRAYQAMRGSQVPDMPEHDIY